MKKLSILIVLIISITTSISFGQAVEGTLLGTWSDETIIASNAHDNVYNEVWGLEVNGHEIAVIGTTFGTHFIDVTDPKNPEEIHVVRGGTVGPSIIHRDFHDYQGYLYSIADEGGNTGLQIIDITMLPDSIHVAYDSREYFTRSHNIFIDTAKARLYSCISNGLAFGYSPLRIFDISNPIDPQPIGAYNNFGGKSVSQVHDTYVQNDTAYLNLGPSGFAIVDFTNVDTPNVISILESAEYPQAGYNHSGWLTEDGNYYYMADENYDSDIKILDLRDLPDIMIPNTFNAEATESSITHNQIVYGDKLYVSYYVDGLQVFDITDPVNPVRELFYDTSTEAPGPGRYRGAWGVYPFLSSGNILVSDMQNGLFVIDGDIPTSTEEVNEADDVQIYPNPTTGAFTIEIGDWSGEVSVRVMDMSGKLVYSQVTNDSSFKVDLENEWSGIYTVIMSTEDNTIVRKLVVE